MNIKIIKFGWVAFLLSAMMLSGCKIRYSFSGASIPEQANTVSIAYFPNNAAMVSPILSSTFTDALKDKFARQTRLTDVREGGDLAFEGEIIGYTSTPSSISSNAGGQEGAVRNRLTITVKVRFTNRYEPEWNFDRSFSAFSDYNTTDLLQSVEGQLIPEIVDQLVEDIFNAAVANW